MKGFIIICILMFQFANTVFSQEVTKGSLSVLKGQGRVNLELDYTQASINGMDEEAFANYEKDWKKDKNDIAALFVGEVMANCNTIFVGIFKNTEYTIKMYVLYINHKGDFLCMANVVNKSGEVLATIEGIRGKGGKFGSKLNLIKDGAEHTGKAFGKFLNKKLKK